MLAQKLDFLQARVLFIRMSREDYAAASFLDDRILTAQTQGGWIPHAQVAPRLANAPRLPLHYIFHAGHTGSTLVSRLLDETGLVHPLREPQTLRQLAEAGDTAGQPDSLLSEPDFDAWLNTQIALWRRGFPGAAAVILKATSSAARLGGLLMDASPESRAIHLNLAPEPYLATLLAGPNSPIDLRGMGGERIRRLTEFLGEAPGALHGLSLGELAAMTWLTERLTQARLSAAQRGRVRAFDFDALLADIPGCLSAIAAHFGLAVAPDYAARVAASPALARYSKAPTEAYSPALRAQILSQARTAHANEIRAGLAWLERLGGAHREVAAILG